jgi:zinc protease
MFCLCLSVFIFGSNHVFAKPPVLPPTAPLEIQVPDFHVKTLSCGMKVIFLKNDEMPLVSAEFFAPGGFRIDPDGKEGLVSLMNDLLRDGGVGKLSPEAFDAALENRAASMSASADMETFTAGFKCLEADLSDILNLFADMLRRPQFDAKRLETDRANIMDSLNRLEDTPDTLTRVLFYRTLLGRSPYGRWASPQSVAKITREDVVKFYQRHFGSQGAVLAVAGKFDEDKVSQQLEKLFAGWKGQEEGVKFEDSKPLGPAIYFFPKDVTQVLVRFGRLGLKRHDPKEIPLSVANYILGGSGFTSRLMQKIRSDRGLAYFVDSYFLPYDIRGPFQVVGGTRPDSVKEYLTLMFQLMEDFAKEGPTGKELEEAKQSMIEEFAHDFESPYTLASYKASLDFHGYPDDYLKTYRDKVKAVTQEQAAQAARAILSQENWVLVVSGPADLEPVLSAFGKVHNVSSIFESLVK